MFSYLKSILQSLPFTPSVYSIPDFKIHIKHIITHKSNTQIFNFVKERVWKKQRVGRKDPFRERGVRFLLKQLLRLFLLMLCHVLSSRMVFVTRLRALSVDSIGEVMSTRGGCIGVLGTSCVSPSEMEGWV